MPGALGRRPSKDPWHLDKYPLTAATTPTVPVPSAIGVNWYSDFDQPQWDGKRWWIGRDPSNLGSVRGGHCVCIEPGDQLDAAGNIIRKTQDITSWWDFYDQGAEGACVGFGTSRMMSLMNRKRYDARWLWDRSKEIDPWSDTRPCDDNGTDVHSAAVILLQRGHVAWSSTYEGRDCTARQGEQPKSVEGISAIRWATSAQQVFDAIKSPASNKLGAVRILNSWGRYYPHRVWMPGETLDRLLREDGEASIITDR